MRALTAALVAVSLAGCATVAPAPPAPYLTPVPAAAPRGALPPIPVTVPDKDRWLYASGESSATAIETYRALTRFALDAAKRRPANSVVLADGSSPTGIGPLSFVPCGKKPLAVVFDADETLIWNIPPTRFTTAERNGAYDGDAWDQWEKTGAGFARAMPGAVEMLTALRKAGITPVANTNRLAANAAGNAATLEKAGLGRFVHGETLFLKGDDSSGSSKDARRALIASRYCVVAMAGDQLGDFSNAFNVKGLSDPARRSAAAIGPAASLWGRGWFMLSNPSYGPWSKASLDETYGAESWRPTLPAVAPENGSIDQVMAAVYATISGPAGPRDWNRFRALFAPGAAMGTVGPKGVRTRGVEDYIAANGPYLKEHAFFETELWRRQNVYGDLAQVWSAYESREVPGGPVTDRGINAIQLARHGDRWLVLSIQWQSETPALPLPAKSY